MKRFFAVECMWIFLAASMAAGQSPADSVPGQAVQTIQMVNVDTELQEAIVAQSINAGDPVSVVILKAAKLNDGPELVKDSRLEGRVVKVVIPAKKGDSSIVLTFDKITLPDGKQLGVKAALVHVRIPSYSPVNPQLSVSDEPGFVKGGGPSQSLPRAPEGLSNLGGDATLRDMPGLTVTGSYQDMSSGTLTIKGRNWSLPKGAHLEIGLVVLPADSVLVAK